MGVLRLLLALAVVIGHAGRPLLGHALISGDLAVQSFYVISGFFITLVFTEKYARQPNGTRLFWINRYLRLWPAFIVVGLTTWGALAVAAILGYDIAAGTNLHYVGNPTAWPLAASTRAILAIPDFLMFGSDWVMFWSVTSTGHLAFTLRSAAPGNLPAYVFLLVPQGWTLGIELSFYLIAPWLLRKSWRALTLVALASVALRLVTYFGLDLRTGPWPYRVFPQELGLFVAGALSFHAYRGFQHRLPAWLLRAGGLVAFVVLVGGMVLYEHGRGDWRHFAYLTAVPVCLPFLFHLTGRNRVDRVIGDLSYPLYVVHIGLLPFLFAAGWSDPHGLTAPVGCTVGALLLYVAVDRPVDRWRHRWSASLS